MSVSKYGDGSDAPQVVSITKGPAALEVYQEAPHYYNPSDYFQPPQKYDEKILPQPRLILGMPRKTFWLAVIAVIVVIGAAVGAGVAGGMAVQKRK